MCLTVPIRAGVERREAADMTTPHHLTLGGLAAAAALAYTRLAPPASSPTSPTVLTFTLVERGSESTFVDERRPGESVGDRHYSAATVRSDGQVAGRAQGECAALDRRYEGHLCHLVLITRQGQSTFTGGGVRQRIPNVGSTGDVFAVTGGTGDYQGAGGELTVGEDGRTLSVSFTS